MYHVQLRLVHIAYALAHYAGHHGAGVYRVGRLGYEHDSGARRIQFAEALCGALVHEFGLLGT